MLTAHTDKQGPDVRALVHTANHNVRDECWDFQPKGEDMFALVKCCHRNLNMKLVCGNKRNHESFWVSVSNKNSDNLWRIEIM